MALMVISPRNLTFFSMMSFSILRLPMFYVSKTAKPRNRALTKCCSALSGSTGSQADLFRFQGTHVAQAAQVLPSIAEPGGQKCLDKVPGDGRSHGPAAHTDNPRHTCPDGEVI
jgi:hypothetical protein